MTELTGSPRVAKYFSLEQGQALVDAYRDKAFEESVSTRWEP
jgi:hypothetical protein